MSPTWEIREGDCVELMRAMDECSVDAVVCDPPYLIGFMGKAFDSQHRTFVERKSNRRAGSFEAEHGNHNPVNSADQARTRLAEGRRAQAWHEAWAREALRVLKPGGHLLAFGGTRTFHRLVCAVEDAGFEIRDTIAWLYGSGFPKSLDVSKAIDKDAGHWRGKAGEIETENGSMSGANYERTDKGDPVTAAAAAAAAGWGTALKPAHEPITVARKPFAGTVAANFGERGTGALNIEACRISLSDPATYARNASGDRGHDGTRDLDRRGATDMRMGGGSEAGSRWPANVVLDEAAAELLDEQTGLLVSGANPTRRGSDKFRTSYGDFAGQRECDVARGVDIGGASRFFYCAKTSRAERDAGLDGFAPAPILWSSGEKNPGSFQSDGVDRSARNHHPTVKPIDLMRWLVRLVTPPGGLVLDPFAGSGTTGCAAVLEGFRFIGLEREPEYVAIAKARIGFWADHPTHLPIEVALGAEAERRRTRASGQASLLEDVA